MEDEGGKGAGWGGWEQGREEKDFGTLDAGKSHREV